MQPPPALIGEITLSTTPDTFTLFDWASGEIDDVELAIHLYGPPEPADSPPRLSDFVEAHFEGYQSIPLAVNPDTVRESADFISFETEIALFNTQKMILETSSVLGYYVVASFANGQQILVSFSPLDSASTFALNAPLWHSAANERICS